MEVESAKKQLENRRKRPLLGGQSITKSCNWGAASTTGGSFAPLVCMLKEALSDATEMSIVLNDLFINVGNDITKSVYHNPKSPTEYLTIRNSDSIILSPVTAVEVNEIILNLDSSKSVGPNSIPLKLLKILGPKFSQPLAATMINQSFSNGIFPSKLKIAKVVPIFKKGDPERPSNYRPISLFPIFSKIYEMVMHKRISVFLKERNILYPLQFGFQENSSIDHALISMTEEIRSYLDNRRYGCGIFVDLQKAF